MKDLLVFLEQALAASTATVLASTALLLPARLRRLRWHAPLLLGGLLLAPALLLWSEHVSAWWLVSALGVLPMAAWIGGGRWPWASWARISGACLAQQAVVALSYQACLVLVGVPGGMPPLLAGLVLLGHIASLLVSLPLAFDIGNTLGRCRFPCRDRLLAAPEPEHWPGVCLQVPAYDEPADLLCATIAHLLRQDYPGRWMIQVIENNTPSPLGWYPVWELCRHQGERVQFVHLHHWTGYKAGALNEGMRRLPAWVEVVAIIDADYQVEPHFLRATARHFADPTVAFVQTPQHYRQWQGVPYFEALNVMYEAFFATYMASRRETNSIICVGTMALLRRSALEQVGLWDEASVTEDAEVSVRLLARGYRGLYDHRAYGAGLMPFDFAALKKQRFRWAFGMIQLLKKHWRPLLGLRSAQQGHLRLWQRACFYGLGLQYLIEVVSLSLALLLVGTSLLSVAGPGSEQVVSTVAGVPLLVFATVCVRTVWALRALTGCTRRQALGALGFFFALSAVTAHACLSALVHRKGVFLRTPKVAQRGRWQRAIATSRGELLLCLGFATAAGLLLWLRTSLLLPALLLLVQAAIYGCAPLCALAAERASATMAQRQASQQPTPPARPRRRHSQVRVGAGGSRWSRVAGRNARATKPRSNRLWSTRVEHILLLLGLFSLNEC